MSLWPKCLWPKCHSGQSVSLAKVSLWPKCHSGQSVTGQTVSLAKLSLAKVSLAKRSLWPNCQTGQSVLAKVSLAKESFWPKCDSAVLLIDTFWLIKSSFSLFGTKLARNQQKISQDFLGFVQEKKHEKVSKSSNAYKNGLREYIPNNEFSTLSAKLKLFLTDCDFLDTIRPSRSLCFG